MSPWMRIDGPICATTSIALLALYECPHAEARTIPAKKCAAPGKLRRTSGGDVTNQRDDHEIVIARSAKVPGELALILLPERRGDARTVQPLVEVGASPHRFRREQIFAGEA